LAWISGCASLAHENAINARNNATAAYNRGDYAEALKILRPLADQGYALAQTNIGQLYAEGKGVTQSYQEALKWLRLAATQGDANAQTYIGYMYYSGEGVTQNYQEALKWYRLAEDQGFAGAQNNIGAMYRDGRGVARDDKEAVKWFRLSAEQGTARGQFNLGFMYRNGRGVTQDDKEALRWFKLAAANGEEKAIAILKSPESPPKLVFNSSTPKADGTVELSGRVISDASISEILINGRALEVSLAKDNSFTVIRGLPMGAVTSYRLSVMDEYGQKAETEINVERAAIQYAEQVAPLNPRKLKAQTNPNAVALIIGVESYLSLPQAKYADSDANHFYDYASQSLGVPPNKIKLLTDSKASRTELLKAMRSWMKTEVNGKSDVYIFFAGHGLASADGSKTYLLPADGDRDLLDETSILRDDLIASAKGAKTITMFLDTCYSGGTRTNEILLADARPIAIVPDKSALPPNVTVLAAASGAQLSSTYEAAQQGLFSYWLMKGLEGDADANKDKKITTGELHDYVARQVGPMAQRRNRQQDPQLMGDSTRVLVSY
jgi:TPR repeat protein